MPDPSKAIGLRLPHHVWEQVKAHGIANYPSDSGKEGIDVTRTVVALLCQALGAPLDAPVSNLSNDMITECITDIVQQQLSQLSNSSSDNDMLSERLTIVEHLLSQLSNNNIDNTSLSERLTAIEKQSGTVTSLTPRDKVTRPAQKVEKAPQSVSLVNTAASDSSPLQEAYKLSWTDFYTAVGLDQEKDEKGRQIRSPSLARVALARAATMGFPRWKYNAKNRNFIQVGTITG
jgi:hypothetical protein